MPNPVSVSGKWNLGAETASGRSRCPRLQSPLETGKTKTMVAKSGLFGRDREIFASAGMGGGGFVVSDGVDAPDGIAVPR